MDHETDKNASSFMIENGKSSITCEPKISINSYFKLK